VYAEASQEKAHEERRQDAFVTGGNLRRTAGATCYRLYRAAHRTTDGGLVNLFAASPAKDHRHNSPLASDLTGIARLAPIACIRNPYAVQTQKRWDGKELKNACSRENNAKTLVILSEVPADGPDPKPLSS
jgi:hypothetical protein